MSNNIAIQYCEVENLKVNGVRSVIAWDVGEEDLRGRAEENGGSRSEQHLPIRGGTHWQQKRFAVK